jgi:hypothetical protein
MHFSLGLRDNPSGIPDSTAFRNVSGSIGIAALDASATRQRFVPCPSTAVVEAAGLLALAAALVGPLERFAAVPHRRLTQAKRRSNGGLCVLASRRAIL